MARVLILWFAIFGVFALLATACQNSTDQNSADQNSADQNSADQNSADQNSTDQNSNDQNSNTISIPPECNTDLDANGDNKLRFGVATPGPRDDGGYYETLVSTIESFSRANDCYLEPIIVDRIEATNAAFELSNLAAQDVDIIAVGASEIAEPLADLTVQYSDIFWYCNCGAGYPVLETLAQSGDDSSEISFTAGYATGLLLQERYTNQTDTNNPANTNNPAPQTAFLGCCDLGFEQESFLAFELGLQAVDPNFTTTYTPTGAFPFDFDNAAGAIEALQIAVAEQDIAAVYPFLGGAHEAVVRLANENQLIVMSAGLSDACENSDLAYDIAVRFDAGDYLVAILKEINDGSFAEGNTRIFRVGVDEEPGALICDATPAQQEAMDNIYSQIASGEYTAEFQEIKGRAYS